MGILTREQFIELENRIDKLYDLRSGQYKDYMSRLFNVQKSDKSEERHMGIGEMAKMMPWGGTVFYDGISKGYEKNYRHTKYSIGIQLEDELFRFKEYNEIAKRTKKAATAVYKTRQYYGSNVFNNAFDDAFAGADAVGLCSAAHPLSPSNAETQGNEGTLALTVANLEATMDTMFEFKDDRGDILNVVPTAVVVGTQQRATALKIVGSDKEAFVADNTTNINADLKVIYNPWIKGKKWFVVDEMMMKDNLNWYDARIAKPEKDGDFDTEIVKFKLVSMFSLGWDNPLFIYGNNPG